MIILPGGIKVTSKNGKQVAEEVIPPVNAGKPGVSSDLSTANAKVIKSINGASTADEFVDILRPVDRQHILYGDGSGSGGHLYPGQSEKTTFPQSWNGDKVIHEVGDIVTSPSTTWYAQTGTEGTMTKAGDPARWIAWETRDGVSMRVVFEPATGRVVTAFPDSFPASINFKPAR